MSAAAHALPSPEASAPDLSAIAARYGATLAPGVTFTRVPRGVSGLPGFFFNEKTGHLESAAPEKQGWKAQRDIARAKAKERQAAVARLHAEGLSDSAMADRLGVSLSTLRADRAALCLRANHAVAPRAQSRRDQLRELVAQGFDDVTIAEQMRTSVKSLRAFAKAQGLVLRAAARVVQAPAPKPEAKPAAPKAPSAKAVALRDGVVAAHAEGLNDRQIAARLGIGRETVRGYRLDAGLPAVCRAPAAPPVSPEVARAERAAAVAAAHAARREKVRAEIRALYAEAGLPEKEVAARLQISVATLRKHRGAMGLPLNAIDKAALRAARSARLRDVVAARHTRDKSAERLAARKDREARLIELFDSGLPLRQCLRQVRMGQAGVKALRAAGRDPGRGLAAATAARKARIRALAAEGASGAKIAAEMGMTVFAVYSFAHAHAISLARPQAERPAVTARRAEVKRLRALGLPFKDIAARLGVTENTVRRDDRLAAQGGAE